MVVGFDYYNQMSLHHISSDTSPDHAPYREVYHYRHDYDQLAVLSGTPLTILVVTVAMVAPTKAVSMIPLLIEQWALPGYQMCVTRIGCVLLLPMLPG